MKPIWRNHLIVSAILVLLAIPVYFLDAALNRGGSGGWITLNFRGLIFWSYVGLIAIHVVLSTISVAWFPRIGAFARHLVIFPISVILLVGAIYGWLLLGDMSQTRQIRALEAKRAPLANVIELKEWWYYPDANTPTEIRVNVVVHSGGRFSGYLTGTAKGVEGFSSTIFVADDEQRRVTMDDVFTHHFKLRFLEPGRATNVSITLWLFDPEIAPDEREIAKKYLSSPEDQGPGNEFFAPLPPPVQK